VEGGYGSKTQLGASILKENIGGGDYTK